MRLTTLGLLTAIAASAATSLPAQSFRAENDVLVTDLGGGLFSAETRTRYGARGAWCAAADYAIDVLRAPGTARIYVREPKASNSAPVVFSLSPGTTSPVGVSSTSAALRTAGANLSVDHAFQFCYDARLKNRP
ncbi:hypothetical protein AB2B41_19380 [Marimonas sp. MJW-29]|uniref:Uncharacterized protein n=1 Tax=Sulfitobacter sediminis TaxID=3234186 RepID=A0ABV3RS14_9RHOB